MNIMLTKTFFAGHYREGEPTDFASKVKDGTKKHTIRCNLDYWREHLAKAQQRGGIVSLREWEGKPYRSPQREILAVPASMVEVQELTLVRERTPYAYCYKATVDGQQVNVTRLANNDGLNATEFTDFFNPLFEKYAEEYSVTMPDGEKAKPKVISLKFAVIQFTTFRY